MNGVEPWWICNLRSSLIHAPRPLRSCDDGFRLTPWSYPPISPISPSVDDYEGPRLFFTMGPARCGKSTYAGRWKRGLEMPEVPALMRVVWNSDDLRLAMTGRRFTRELEPQVHTTKMYALKALLTGGYTVLVDGTHTTPRSIHELLRLDVDAVPIPFDTPVEECVRRAHATGQPDVVPAIERHAAQLKVILEGGLDRMMDVFRAEVLAHDAYRWRRA